MFFTLRQTSSQSICGKCLENPASPKRFSILLSFSVFIPAFNDSYEWVWQGHIKKVRLENNLEWCWNIILEM